MDFPPIVCREILELMFREVSAAVAAYFGPAIVSSGRRTRVFISQQAATNVLSLVANRRHTHTHTRRR